MVKQEIMLLCIYLRKESDNPFGSPGHLAPWTIIRNGIAGIPALLNRLIWYQDPCAKEISMGFSGIFSTVRII